MNRIYYLLFVLLFIAPTAVFTQTIKFSDYDGEDNRNMNFDIIGKMNDKILVYKNIRWRHKISVYDNDMKTLKSVGMAFVPEKTFNIDFVAYPDFFYMIYQYQKRNVLYCMAVKMNADAKPLSEPVLLDTTQIPVLTDNKIYSTIISEDKKKIMIFKIQTNNQKFNMATLLFDDQMTLIKKSRQLLDYNDRRDNFDNYLLANDGTLVLTYDRQSGNRDNSNTLALYTLAPLQDLFTMHNIELNEKYIDQVKLKIDNLNNRYIINTFYYKKNRGSIEGLFTCIWDKVKEKKYAAQFTELGDGIRDEVKRDGLLRFAFDNFFIRQVVIKKDGGFILTAEDYSSQSRSNNSWSRYDYLYNPYSLPSGSYYYNPYTGYYRPVTNFNDQNTRYFYENIFVLSVSKTGQAEWYKVIQKDQFDDNEDNFMSFLTLINKGEIHFLFNDDKKYRIISDQGISPDGTLIRYPTIKSDQKGYEFMPSLGKQVGANQVIIPCAYRNTICFAKVSF